ncbi:hypothetical protein D3H35_06805 [Cohnella faecalis]|uniref:Uncharacterized protein n=2 Tax=Cohnella faecalis TaxID=2315694 RepID=A0A398CP21_9BACL|nr:hypothetical protein D3H35_06805 [Cohnella faecalis]
MTRQRHLNNEELAVETDIAPNKIRAWIRSGKFKIYDYPNLADNCDLCRAPIRSGKLCYSCTTRIKDDVEKVYQQERLMRERLRQANAYISRK